MAITPAMTGMSGMSWQAGGAFSPASLGSNLRQWFLDQNKGYRSSKLNGIPVLESLEPSGTYREPRQGRCYLFDATDDVLDIGDTSASVTQITITVKLGTTNQVLFTVDGVAATGGVSVSGGDLTYGSGFSGTSQTVDGASKTATEAGTLLNDGSFHTLVITCDSIAVDDLNIGTDGTSFGDIYVSKFGLGASDADGLWNCNEESGLVAYDVSGNGNNGVLTSITQSTFHATDTGVTSNQANEVGFTPALSFDGTDDQVDLDTEIDETDCSVSMWVRPNTIGYICMSENDAGGSYIQFQSTTNIRVATESAGQSDDFTVPTMTAGNWYHLVVTKDSTSYRVYLNGTESSSGAQTGGSNFKIDTIGGFTGNSFDWEGQIESVQVYDDVLTDNEVTFLYDGTGDDPTSDNLILDLQFDEMTGTIAYDGSGSGNNGTLADDATWHVIPRDESDTDNDVRGAALKFVGKSPFPAQVNVPCVTFDGVNDHIDIGNISASATEISFYVKSLVDDQELFTLQDSTATAVDVASGVLTFGGSLNVTAITVDGVTKTAAQAGALINDNTWHKVVLTLDSISVSDLNLGCDATGGAFGNISLAEFKINTSGADGYWPLHEGAGNIAHDVSGNDNHGTLTSFSVTDAWANTTNAVEDYSINYGGTNVGFFDGADDQIELGTEISETNCSISLWLWFSGINDICISERDVGNSYILIQTTTNIRWVSEGTGPTATLDFTVPAMSTGTWYHIAGTKNGGDYRLWLNGSESSSGTQAAKDTFKFDTVGGYVGSSFQWSGFIRNVRIYDDILTESEIGFLYDGDGDDPGSSNLILHLKLDGDATDSSGNGDDATANGTTFPFIPADSSGLLPITGSPAALRSANKLGNINSEIDTNPYTAAELNGLGAETDYSLTDTRQDQSPNDTKFRRTDTDGDDRFFTTDEALTGADKTSAEEYVS